MNYESGEEIKVGDIVQIEHGNTKGAVIEILLSKEDFYKWNLEFGRTNFNPILKAIWQGRLANQRQ